MIKTEAGINQVLKNYDSKGWNRKTDFKLNTEFNNFPSPASPEANPANTKSFGDFLSESIGKVNELQKNADVAMQKLASGESKNLHETMIAVEQADIAFKAMNQIRLKVIDAYKEIMRMQI